MDQRPLPHGSPLLVGREQGRLLHLGVGQHCGYVRMYALNTYMCVWLFSCGVCMYTYISNPRYGRTSPLPNKGIHHPGAPHDAGAGPNDGVAAAGGGPQESLGLQGGQVGGAVEYLMGAWNAIIGGSP